MARLLDLRARLAALETADAADPDSAISTFTPTPAARPFYESSARFAVAVAGVRSGKTYTAARAFVRRMIADRSKPRPRGGHPGLHYWCVAPTHELNRIQYRELFGVLAPAGLVASTLRSAPMSILLHGRTLIEFRSAHNPLHLVGAGLDGIWGDEAARWDSESWSGQLRMRLSDRAGWAIFSTTPLARNWFFREIFSQSIDAGGDRDDYRVFRWTTADNTAVPGLVAEVERAREELPARYFEREYLASFDAFQGQIFDEFRHETHVVPESSIPPRERWRERVFGVDWGTVHQGAAIVLVTDSDGFQWVVDERVTAGRLVDWWVDTIRELIRDWGQPSEIRCDPSRVDNIRAMQRAGVAGVRPAANAVAPGIEHLARLLHVRPEIGPTLRISARCRELIRTIQGYRWADNAAREEPVKSDDDAVDALRYAAYNPARIAMTGVAL